LTLDVNALWLLPFKNTESEKNDINVICEVKGREFNSRPLGHFVLSFVWAAGWQRK
jgi:hypothetical protein